MHLSPIGLLRPRFCQLNGKRALGALRLRPGEKFNGAMVNLGRRITTVRPDLVFKTRSGVYQKWSNGRMALVDSKGHALCIPYLSNSVQRVT